MITTAPGSKVIATGVSHEAFMAGYQDMRVEWVDGMVVEMPSIDEKHDALMRFLRPFLDAYLSLTGGGRTVADPMIMKLADISSRAPDLQVLLPGSLSKLQKNIVIGAADLVVEIVSEGSHRIDRVEKFDEYERGGVPEYWILDWRFKEALFYQLNADGHFERIAPDDSGIYHSKMLPGLHLPVALLWRDMLPDVLETVELVRNMLNQSEKPEK